MLQQGGLRKIADQAIDLQTLDDDRPQILRDQLRLLQDVHRSVPSIRSTYLFECYDAPETVFSQPGDLDFHERQAWRVPSLEELLYFCSVCKN